MTKTINGVSDRLLSMFVPKVKAKADQCGEYYSYCGCFPTPDGWLAFYRFCCRNGGCNSTCYSHHYC
jgi:hypothetical protein